MSTETRKIALGTAALALVAAASLSPVALADISVPLAPGDSASSDDSGVGTSAGKARNNRGAKVRTNTDSDSSAGSNNTAPAAPEADAPESDAALEDALESLPSADTSAAATGSNPLLQNSLWWFGSPNPTPPPQTIITQTEPLADLPGWMRPSYGWFTETNIEQCVLGLSNTHNGQAGPYGTVTTAFSSRGC